MFSHETLTLTSPMVKNGLLDLETWVDLRLWHGARWEKSGRGCHMASQIFPVPCGHPQAWTTVRSMNLNEGIPSLSSEPSCRVQTGCLIGLYPHLPSDLVCSLWTKIREEMARISWQIRPGNGEMAKQSPKASCWCLSPSQHYLNKQERKTHWNQYVVLPIVNISHFLWTLSWMQTQVKQQYFLNKY